MHLFELSSGAGNVLDPNYVTYVDKLQSAGITVLGYIATGTGSFSDAFYNMTNYKSFYKLNGTFFDQVRDVDQFLPSNILLPLLEHRVKPRS